jgi:uncharacterized membrane protein
MTAGARSPSVESADARLERSIGRLLTGGSYAAIVLLAMGFGLMLLQGIDPVSGGPTFDVASIPGDVLHLRPAGFIALGLIVTVATPASRVLASLFGYGRRGERRMAFIAAAILFVILLSVVVASAVEG